MKSEHTPAPHRQQPTEPVPFASAHEPGSEAARAERLRGLLSDLADGQAHALDEACARWRDDPQARQTWHTYHLIGDVLRSEELAASPARDAQFLAGFRSRLAAEPVLLAPEPVPQPAAPAVRRPRWAMPAAMAAGFMLVAGALVVTRLAGPGGTDLGGAAGGLAQAPVQQPAPPLQAVPSLQAVDNSGRTQAVMLRNPALAEYLHAHQAARMGVAVAAPGGGLRRVDIAVPAGPGQ